MAPGRKRAVTGGIAANLRGLAALARSGVVRPVMPHRLARMALGAARYGLSLTAGYVAGAARHPDRDAIVDDLGRLSYAQVHERTDRLARALSAWGLGVGDRMGVLCRNHRWAVETQVAAGKLGMEVVLLNTGMSAGQLAAVGGELELHVLFTDPEFDAVVSAAAVTAPVVRTGEEIEQLAARAGEDPLPLRPPAASTIVLTSGTTGNPKGARRPALRSMAPVGAILSTIPLLAGEPIMIAAPVLHSWGHAALQLAVMHGATAVLTARFDPARLLDVVERDRCGVVIAVPVMLQRVLELPADTLDGAWRAHAPRVVAVSGSALTARLATAFMDRFGEVLYNLYGSTEVSWVSIATPEDLRVAPGTAGRLPVGTRLAILDEHDRPVPPGTDGRIFVGNAMPFDGYTGAAADVERHRGLLGTGDLGHVDDDGRLHVTGRADDMIISGGENVHPGPVETLLAARPEVREVAVVGVDDEQYGQRLAAYVVPGPGAVVGPEEVRGWVRAALGSFSVPRDVVFLDELPRNATGKVARKNLPRH